VVLVQQQKLVQVQWLMLAVVEAADIMQVLEDQVLVELAAVVLVENQALQ
jgi:hypothetical protein